MQRQKPFVFVSSTTEFARERQRIAAELRTNFELFLHEEDFGGDMSPEERLRSAIHRSDIFLAILGTDWGSAYPSGEDSNEEVSIVEWEFRTAERRRDQNPGRLSIMPFIRKGAETSAENPRQRRFLAQVKAFGGKWVKFFSSGDELTFGVVKYLLDWATQRVRPAFVPRWAEIAVLSGTVTCVALVVLVCVRVEDGWTRLAVAVAATFSAIGGLLVWWTKYGGTRAKF